MKISQRIACVEPSQTLAVTSRAKELKAQGKDIISFGAGETDFDTPEPVKQAAIDSLNAGFTHYTAVSGIPELKQAVCEKFKQDNGLDFDPSQVIISCGAKHTLYNIFQCICDPGDEVILTSPYWVSYKPQIEMTGAVPVLLDTSGSNFTLDPANLAKKITSRTRAFLINNPGNPTGTYMGRSRIEALAAVLKDRDILVISDEIYEELVYTDEPYFSIANADGMKERTIVVNGVSKSYSMTGWRIGYAAGPKDIISAMNRLQSHSTSNPVSFAQNGAVAALKGGKSLTAGLKKVFRERRDLIYDLLTDIDGIEIVKPEGAFYAFPRIAAFLGKQSNGKPLNGSVDFCEALLEAYGVAAVPGIAFGHDDYIRVSYAVSLEDIRKGLKRLSDFISSLK